ncbi:MAG TPA: rod shape-determining protein MreD [Gemmatimonadales bacterium]|nr:rod shape-determining protein MreD [Gemmatimonadales bacterium]
MNSRRGAWPLWLVLGLLVLLHFYLRPRLYAGRGAPDFLLLALLIAAFRSRPGTAAVAGFILGLVEDVLTPARFGAGMMAHTIVAYLAAWGRAVFFADNLLVNAGLFATGTILRNFLVLLVSGGGASAILGAVSLMGLLQAVTTAIAGTLVVLAIRHRVDFRLEE